MFKKQSKIWFVFALISRSYNFEGFQKFCDKVLISCSVIIVLYVYVYKTSSKSMRRPAENFKQKLYSLYKNKHRIDEILLV